MILFNILDIYISKTKVLVIWSRNGNNFNFKIGDTPLEIVDS
jgi:hypothetical protein